MALKIGTTFSGIDNVSGVVKKIGDNSKKVSGQISKSVSKASNSFSTLKKFAAGALAAISIAAITGQITGFATLADEIGKTSRRLGITAEAYQELKFAGDIAGVSASGIDKAISKMNESIGKAAAGTGRLTSLLKKTNPELLNQVKGAKNSEEAFDLLIDELARMPDAASKTALATAAFGGAGKEMLQLAEGGAEGLNKMREEARRLGLVIGSDAVAESEEFNDAITRVSGVVSGLRNTALIPVIRTLTPLIDQMREWIAENRVFIGQGIEVVIGSIGFALSAVFKVASTVVSVITKINSVFGGILIPAIVGGVVAFKAITVAIATYKAVLLTVTAVKLAVASAGGILNAVLLANPIGLVIAAVVALIAIGIALWKNWDVISEFFSNLWVRLKSAFVTGVKALGNVLLHMHPAGLLFVYWEPITEFFSNLWGNVVGIFNNAKSQILAIVDSIISIVGPVISAVGSLFGGGSSGGGGAGAGGGGVPESPGAPVGGNSAIIRSQSESRSTVDVNFNNPPAGTSIRQRGRAPGVNLNRGRTSA